MLNTAQTKPQVNIYQKIPVFWGVVRIKDEMFLCYFHLLACSAHGDQRETFLYSPGVHHLWHVNVRFFDLEVQGQYGEWGIIISQQYFMDREGEMCTGEKLFHRSSLSVFKPLYLVR